MIKVMTKYDIYDTEKDSIKLYDPQSLENTITDEDRSALYSAFRYIMWTSHLPQPKWTLETEVVDGVEHTSYLSFEKIFGIKEEREDEKLLTYNKSFKVEGSFDISRFKRFARINGDDFSYKWIDGKMDEYAREIPEISFTTEDGDKYTFEEFFFSLGEDVNKDEPVWYEPDDKVAFCFTSVEYKYNPERKLFYSYYYYGYVFYKY